MTSNRSEPYPLTILTHVLPSLASFQAMAFPIVALIRSQCSMHRGIYKHDAHHRLYLPRIPARRVETLDIAFALRAYRVTRLLLTRANRTQHACRAAMSLFLATTDSVRVML